MDTFTIIFIVLVIIKIITTGLFIEGTIRKPSDPGSLSVIGKFLSPVPDFILIALIFYKLYN
tara:strand:- start:371 stop:556 length:186 start_codon:yes stop_codon:yes gene_type:complete